MSLDRPAHVRAGSSLARVAGRLALIQDDANFVALVDPDTLHVRAIPLPTGASGQRQFDDLRGNKMHKLDLEACVAVESAHGMLLMVFGSGSTSVRETVALVNGLESAAPNVHLVRAAELYDLLRREQAFAGSELNVEGAVRVGERIRLFGRGNGAARADVTPLNATCDIELQSLLAYLHAPHDTAPPAPTRIVRYELGTLGGLALGFTDATVCSQGEAVLYCAAAEDSPDATRDGRVSGSAIGVMDADGRVRWTPLVDASGRVLECKVEGLATSRTRRDQLYVVMDADDPTAASELCIVELRGRW